MHVTLFCFSDDPDMEEFQLEIEESKLQTSIQCTPLPGILFFPTHPVTSFDLLPVCVATDTSCNCVFD